MKKTACLLITSCGLLMQTYAMASKDSCDVVAPCPSPKNSVAFKMEKRFRYARVEVQCKGSNTKKIVFSKLKKSNGSRTITDLDQIDTIYITPFEGLNQRALKFTNQNLISGSRPKNCTLAHRTDRVLTGNGRKRKKISFFQCTESGWNLQYPRWQN